MAVDGEVAEVAHRNADCAGRCPTVSCVRWEALFADMEARLDAASSAELLSEVADRTRSERATIALTDRLRGSQGRRLGLQLCTGALLEGVVADAAPAWVLLADGVREHLVPVAAIDGAEGLADLAAPAPGEALRRLGLGHALRALARDRQVVRVETRAAASLGRVDLVAADHLDVGVADPASLRPTGRRRTVPFAAVVAVTSL